MKDLNSGISSIYPLLKTQLQFNTITESFRGDVICFPAGRQYLRADGCIGHAQQDEKDVNAFVGSYFCSIKDTIV